MNVGFENQAVYTAAATGVVAVGNVSAVQLPGTGAGLVFLKAGAGNAGTITLGGSSGVTAGQGWNLAAGDVTPPLPLNTLSQLWAIADQAGQSLEYVVMS